MAVFVYQNGQRKPPIDPSVYIGPAKVPVQTIWAYQGGRRYLVWARTPATLTATSDRWDRVALTWTAPGAGADSYKVYRGSTLIYSGANLAFTDTSLDPAATYGYRLEALRAGAVVGEATTTIATGALSMKPMTATTKSMSQIDLSWTNPGGLTGVVIRNKTAGSSANLAGTATTYSSTSLTAGTTYAYEVDGQRGTQKWSNLADASATTSPQLYEPKTVTLDADYRATYKENGDMNAWNGASSTKFMSGRYDSTNGLQKSGFHFPVPADVRTCEYIESIEFSVQNDHWANGSGATQYLAITHTPLGGDAWARWPGATGAFGGRYTYLDRWYGGAQSTTTRHWVDITNDREPTYGDTVAGNFRNRGAQGICLVQTSTAQSAYGYFHGNAQLRIKYVVKK